MNIDLDAAPSAAKARFAVAQSPALGILLGLLKAAGMRALAPICKAIRLCAAIVCLGLACDSVRTFAQTPPSQQSDATQSRGVTVTSPPKAEKNNAWRHHKDYALLFATNDYEYWQPLINPIPDAEAIARVLEENYGFTTEIVENPTHRKISEKIRDYAVQKHFDDSDQLFIFFAGHGLYDEAYNQGFIVAKDSRNADDDLARDTYVSYDDLRRRIDAIPAKHIFLVLDACYSGTFDPRVGEGGARGADIYADYSLPDLFQDKVRFKTRRYLTSGGKRYVFDGIPGHHSPFVAHLLEVLGHYGGKQGFLTLPNLVGAMQTTKPVPQSADWEQNDPGSEFFFISKHLTAELEKTSPSVEDKTAAEADLRGLYTVEPPATAKSRPSIAVVGFKNLSGRTDDALSTALSEFLTTEIAASTELRTLAGESVAKAKLDLDLKNSSGYANATLSRIYKALGADYVVSGSYLAQTGQSKSGLRVDIRLQNARTGEGVAAFRELGTQTELSELVTRIGGQLRAKLGVASPSPADAAAAKAAIPSISEGARLYAEGLTKLRAYDLLGARDTLERAVAAEPTFALAHLALARTLSELGYDSLATRETRAAMEHSAGLARPSVLTIEGTHQRLTGQWEEAIDTYRTLWRVYPDETDYALELADVQSSAGKGRDALATLDRLRKRSKHAVEDPRVDLEEAFAASTLADFRLQHEASVRAIKNAGEGARLLSAQAYWRDCSALLGLGQLKDAEAACSQANHFSDFSGGQQVKARSSTVLANVMVAQGMMSEAMGLRQQALGLARQIGSKKDIIGALMNLANLQSSVEAKKGYEEAIATAQEIGDKQQLAEAQLDLASVLFKGGDYGGAQERYLQSLQTANATGDKESEATVLQDLGLVSFQLGNLSEAKDKLQQSIAVAQACSSRSVQATSFYMLGDLLFAQNDIPHARKFYDDALDLFTALEDQSGIATIRQSLAELRLEEAKPSDAEALARQAVEEFVKEKSADQEAEARETLARALMEQGKQTEALQEIEIAGKLAVEDRAIRLSLAVTGAKLSARASNNQEARTSLQASLAEAARLKLVNLQLEIRLALGETENFSDAASAQNYLNTLEQDANRRGYLLVAAKAGRLRQAKLAESRKAGAQRTH